MIWRLPTTELSLNSPRLMGILNVTPDSFSDGGIHGSISDAVRHGLAMVEEGADLIDVGGESTRPGAPPVSVEAELARVLPVVAGLVAADVIVSIDTTKPEVARAACAAGASVINDVSGMSDGAMRQAAIESQVGVVVMHKQGEPQTMQDNPSYGDVVSEVGAYLDQMAGRLVAEGLRRDAIVVDPGIGFGKTVEHNLALLNRIGEVAPDWPVLLGVSRKRFLDRVLEIPLAGDRDRASATALALAVDRGVRLFRVHDIPSSLEAVRLAWAIVREGT